MSRNRLAILIGPLILLGLAAALCRMMLGFFDRDRWHARRPAHQLNRLRRLSSAQPDAVPRRVGELLVFI